VGDIIIEIDGKKLSDEKNTTIATYINKKKIGDSLKIKFWRVSGEQTVEVKLEKRGQ
jgi:S1-C subfamily serine protease